MKKSVLKSGLFGLLALALASFTTGGKEKKAIKVAESSIEWVGKKVTGQHNGTINFKEGFVVVKHGVLKEGTFVVDMNTISCDDLSGKNKVKIEGHLKSDDFFGVENHPTATFVVKSVKGNKVTGDITIKGHTETKTFDLTVSDHSITGTIKIDRTKYGIKYGSSSFFDNLKDKAINNEFELTLNVKF